MLRELQFGFSRQVPVVLQAEASECALACLAMVMGYHGHPIDIATIRRRFGASARGTTLRELMGLSAENGLDARAVRLEIEDIDKLAHPSILHWGLNHFVVLVACNGSTATIHDPATGRRTLSMATVSRYFTGVALDLTPTERFEQRDDRDTLKLRDLWARVRGLRPALTHLFLLSIGLELLALIAPMMSQVIFDEVLVTHDFDLLTTISCGMVLLLLLQMLVGTIRSWAVVMFGSRVSLAWNGSLFEHLTRLPLDYFTRRHLGDIISRFGSLGAIQKTLTTDLVQTILDGIMGIGMGVMLFLYGGWLGIIACIALVLDIALRLVTYDTYRQASEEAIVQGAKTQTHFIETLHNIATVKLLNLRERRRREWLNNTIEGMNIHLRLQRFDLLFGRLGDLIFGADRLIMLVLGAKAVMSGSMSVGMLVAFLSYKDQFARRVNALVGTVFQLRMLNLQTERLSDIVLTEPEPSENGFLIGNDETELTGELEVQNLSLRYDRNTPWIVRNISLTIPQGASIAFVGASGCGKTTLLKALMGLSEADEGHIFLDDNDIRHPTLDSYRSQIAGVLQDDGLFSGTIGDNISGFSEDAKQEDVERAARIAEIHDTILSFPMRYETLVGDMGSTLSGGQKQRIILARALYRNPRILFLDEATSHLDESTESAIARQLADLNMTRVMVAHRPATIAHADYVYRIDKAGLHLVRGPDQAKSPKSEKPAKTNAGSSYSNLLAHKDWPRGAGWGGNYSST